MGRRVSHECFLQKLSEQNNNIEILSEYKSAREKILCRCKICGHEWMAEPSNLLQGKGCSPCGRLKNAKALSKSHEQFINDLYKINPDIQVYGTYINNHTKMQCKCLKCQHEWDSTPANLLKSRGCPQCSLKEKGLKRRMTHEEFVARVSISNPNIEIVGEYTRTMDNICCQCKTCKHVWESRASQLLKSMRCPKCSPRHTSFLEQTILISLRNILGKQAVLSRDTQTIGKEIDIYIPSLKVGIEPGNWHWHSDKTANDLQKYQLAKNNNIRLIVVFDDFDADRDSLSYEENDLITYNEYLGAPSKRAELWHCVKAVFQQLNIQYSFSPNDENNIIQLALQNSIACEKDYIAEITRKHPNIEMLDTYQGYNTKIRCVCKKCQHEWAPSPATLLRGSGCPVCNKQKIVKNITTGEVFQSIDAAAEKTGLNREAISHACKGKTKTCGGFMWAFVPY